MKEKKKLNKVSWAPGSKLCQVKVIRKADPPPQKMPNNHPPPKVGPKMPNIPTRRKPSNFPASCPSAYVPFKKESNIIQLKDKLPQIKWEIPPSFVLESDWLVASGEESSETKVQKLRESNVPEAVYPRISAIPPSPSIPLDVKEDRCLDDSQTPVIPIIPIEEADSSAPSPLKTLDNMLLPKPFLLPNSSNGSKPAPVEGDTLLAAVAAATAIMKSMDPGSMIDTDLLVKYLKDPELTLQLINEYRLVANNVSGPYKSKMLEPCYTEPGRKAIEEVSAPLLTKPSGQPTKTATGLTKPSDQPTKTAIGLTKPSDQPTKAARGEKDRVGKSDTKTGTAGGGSIIDLSSKKFIGAQSQLEMVKSEMFKILNPIISPPIVAGSGLGSCFTFNTRQKPDSPPIMQTQKTSSEQCHQTNAENIAPTIPRPLIHSQGENFSPTVPRPLIHSQGENIAPIIPRPLIHSQGENSVPTVPRPLIHSQGENIAPIIPRPLIHSQGGQGENATPTIPRPLIHSQGENFAPIIPSPLIHSQGENAVPTIPRPLIHSQGENITPTIPRPLIHLQGENFAPTVPRPLIHSQGENFALTVPRPLIHSQGENIGPTIQRPLIHSQGERTYGTGLAPGPHIMHTDNAATVQLQYHMNNTEKVDFTIPRSLTHTVVGERTYETGLTMARYTFSNYASGRQEPVATSGGLVTEKQQVPQPRLPAGLHMNSELKDEHGGHYHVAKAHAVRINPTVGNPSQPDPSVFKRMIRDYGLSDNCTGSEPNSARPTQHSSVYGAPVFSANKTNVPQLKYFSYYQFLSKQHGDTQSNSCWDHHQQSPPHNNTQSSNNMHIYKPKTQESCSYFDTARRCRNGSTHEVFVQKRPMAATTHEAGPDAKRMKLGLGREIIGRT